MVTETVERDMHRLHYVWRLACEHNEAVLRLTDAQLAELPPHPELAWMHRQMAGFDCDCRKYWQGETAR